MEFTANRAERVAVIAARILKLMRKDGCAKQILRLSQPWDLFKIGLKCSDLVPSYAEAYMALVTAKANYIIAQRRKAGSE